VLLLAGAGDAALTDDLPAAASPAALVVLDEELRPDAADTLAYFADAHVEIKVISGDDPRTVGAIAARVGLGSGREAVDARTLPAPGPALDLLVDETAVFGRTTPAQKREIVASLHRLGRTVAMTGDGVNDVLALKDADLGVAVGSGAPAARAVAKVVLLDDSFASLPAVVAEGRRVIANVERVANLFVTKTAYALVLAVAVGVAGLPFPFLPRHLTIVSSLTIGIPGFFLALQRGDAPARGAFVGRTLRFALPAGSVAAAATLMAYRVADDAPGTTLPAARTAATIALFAVATWVLSILARPFDRLRAALVGTMPAAFVVLLAVPWVRSFFALPLPPLIVLLSTIGVAAIGIGLLEGGWRTSTWLAAEWRRRQRAPQRSGS
jgi:cation-transporting ATPase E